MNRKKQTVRYARVTTARRIRKRVHVVVAEKALGKQLPEGVVVHHFDEDGFNNANSNLVICEDQAYHALLHKRQRILNARGNPDTDLVCGRCGAVKPATLFYKSSFSSDGHKNACIGCFPKLATGQISMSLAAINSRKTHCKYGHELTKENTYIHGDGKRICRICKCRRSRLTHARRKAKECQ